MAWIEVHQTLPPHRKLKKLKRLLKIKTPQAVGHVVMLWLWAIDNTPDGDLSQLDPEDIADACEWPKDAELFLDAMKTAGLIDDDLHLHDWKEYTGELMESRERKKEQARERKRRQRERDRQRREQKKQGDNSVSHEPVTRDNSVSHAPNSTVPYSTVPYPTVQYPTVPMTKTNSFSDTVIKSTSIVKDKTATDGTGTGDAEESEWQEVMTALGEYGYSLSGQQQQEIKTALAGADCGLVPLAADRATVYGAKSVSYICAILQECHDLGIITIDQFLTHYS